MDRPTRMVASRVNDYLAAVSTERFRHAAPGHRACSAVAVRAIPPPTAGSSDSAGTWGTGRPDPLAQRASPTPPQQPTPPKARAGPGGQRRRLVRRGRSTGARRDSGGTHRGPRRLRWREGLAPLVGVVDDTEVVGRSGMPVALTVSSPPTGLVPEEGSSGLPGAQLMRRLTGGTVGVNHALRTKQHRVGRRRQGGYAGLRPGGAGFACCAGQSGAWAP